MNGSTNMYDDSIANLYDMMDEFYPSDDTNDSKEKNKFPIKT